MSADSKTLIRLRDVGVTYTVDLKLWGGTRHKALSGLNFEIYAGETLGVLGRNGAGKSTLMSLLADIIAPDEGAVERFTHRVQLLSLRTGFVQDLTGRQNAIMAGLLLGLRRWDIEARLESILEFSELGEKFDEPIRSYSTGMLARLGFAIAIQGEPELLLIDEAMGVGDASFRPKVQQIIKERLESSETVVIVSHNEETLKQYCHRSLWLEGGCLRKIGSTEEVIEAYRASIGS